MSCYFFCALIVLWWLPPPAGAFFERHKETETRPWNYTNAIAFITKKSQVDELITNLGLQWFEAIATKNTGVLFMVGGSDEHHIVRHSSLVNTFYFRLKCDDNEYPPFDKTAEFFSALNILVRKGSLPFDWILVSDSDTYMRPDTIELLSTGRDPKERHYLGRPLHHCFCNSNYEAGKRCQLEQGINYCSGMGYLLSRGTIESMNGSWSEFKKSFVKDGMLERCSSSDTWVGWALSQRGILCADATLLQKNHSYSPPSGISWGAPDENGIKTKHQTAFCQNRHHQGGISEVGNLGKTYKFSAEDFRACLMMHPLKNEAQFRYVQFAISTFTREAESEEMVQVSPPSGTNGCRVGIGVFAVRNKPVPRDAIRTTWKRVAEALPGVRVYFIVARSKEQLPAHEELAIHREAQMHSDIVELDMIDAYDALFTKTVSFLEWGVEKTDCEYFFKTDDDSYLRILPLLNFISKIEKENPKMTRKYFGKQWGQHGGKRSPVVKDPKNPWYNFDLYPHDYYPPYMSGSGYGLSRKLAHDVVLTAKLHPAYRCEDAGIGILVDDVRKGSHVEFYTDPNYFAFECNDDMIVENPAFNDGLNMYTAFENDLSGDFCGSNKIKRKFLGGRSQADALLYVHPMKFMSPPKLPWDRKGISLFKEMGSDPPVWKFVVDAKFFGDNTVSALTPPSKQFVEFAIKTSDRRAQAIFTNCFNQVLHKAIFVCSDFAWSRTDVAVMYKCAVDGVSQVMLTYGSYAANHLAKPLRLGINGHAGELAIVVPFGGKAHRLEHLLLGSMKDYVEYDTSMKRKLVIICGLVDALDKHKQCDNDPQFQALVQKYRSISHGKVTVSVITITRFSRSAALNAGIKSLSDSTVAVMMDVDCKFKLDFLDRSIGFVRQGESVYFPIVFSRYSAESILVSRHQHVRRSVNDSYFIHPDVGSWRSYGFGMLAATVADLKVIGLFDEEFLDWGDEDYDIWTRFVKARYQVWRVYEPSLIHVYHSKNCQFAETNLDKFSMCMASKYSNQGTAYQLGMQFYKTMISQQYHDV